MNSRDFIKAKQGFVIIRHKCSHCKRDFNCILKRSKCRCKFKFTRDINGERTLFLFCKRICFESSYISEDDEDIEHYCNSDEEKELTDSSDEEKVTTVDKSDDSSEDQSESSSESSSSEDTNEKNNEDSETELEDDISELFIQK